LFLAGLAISQSSGIKLPSNNTLYFIQKPEKTDYTKYSISKIFGKCSNVQFSYYGVVGNILDFDFESNVSEALQEIELTTPYLDYFAGELTRYEHTNIHSYENVYLNTLSETLSTDW
jgi:hypothetical protein